MFKHPECSAKKLLKNIKQSTDRRITIGLVVPYDFEKNPESHGGGIVRLSQIYSFLNSELNIIKIPWKVSRVGILDIVINFFTILRSASLLLRHGAVAVITANPFIIDVWMGCLVSKISRTFNIVFVNAIPLIGYVGYKTTDVNGVMSFSQIIDAVRKSEHRLDRLIIMSLGFYVLFRCLKNSIIVPLTSEIELTLKKLGFTCVTPVNAVGCKEFHSTNSKNFDAINVVSLFHPDKGIIDVIDIWELVQEKMPNAKLLLVGREHPNYNLSSIFNYLNEKKLKSIKILTSSQVIPNKLIIKMLSKAKLLIYPSRKDVTPIIVSEALGCGIPVVTYDLDGIRQVYGDSKAVIRIPLGKKQLFATEVLNLLSDQRKLEVMRKYANEWCRENPWEKVANITLRSYFQAMLVGIRRKKKPYA
jgi:glycosyltransferase involved in cell wall biosynthesis